MPHWAELVAREFDRICSAILDVTCVSIFTRFAYNRVCGCVSRLLSHQLRTMVDRSAEVSSTFILLVNI